MDPARSCSSPGPDQGATPRRISAELEEQGFVSLGQVPRSPMLPEQHPALVDFTKHLSARVGEVWQNRHGSRYKYVRMLLVYWEADDLGVLREIGILKHVFSDLFFYDVSQYAIPNHCPDRSLKRRVLDFVEGDCKDTLLIFYYAGHAFINTNRHDAPVWTANRRPDSASLLLSGIQSTLEEAQCDVLLLYDTCHSADTAVTSARTSRGMKEVIAACGFESIAAEVGQHSFTNALANILAMASNGQPISVSELQNRLVGWLKRWQPSPNTDFRGHFLRGQNGDISMELQRRRTPVYCNLTPHGFQRSILLAPLPPAAHTNRRFTAHGSTLNSTDREFPPERNSLRNTADINFDPEPELSIAIKLVDEVMGAQWIPDHDVWVEWLRNAPPEAREMEISLKEHGSPARSGANFQCITTARTAESSLDSWLDAWVDDKITHELPQPHPYQSSRCLERKIIDEEANTIIDIPSTVNEGILSWAQRRMTADSPPDDNDIDIDSVTSSSPRASERLKFLRSFPKTTYSLALKKNPLSIVTRWPLLPNYIPNPSEDRNTYIYSRRQIVNGYIACVRVHC